MENRENRDSGFFGLVVFLVLVAASVAMLTGGPGTLG
jgi:hypothetical protein